MGNVPEGFRFYPTEEELLLFYLHNKLHPKKRKDLNNVMELVVPVVGIYDYNPWDLPQLSGPKCVSDREWFFFVERQESESLGGRPKRLTRFGYWKATGSPSHVYSSENRVIGMKRTMVFYTGRAPTGKKTEWKMNEYQAIIQADASSSRSQIPMLRQEFSLCRVYKKSKCLRAFDRRPTPAPPFCNAIHSAEAAQQAPRGEGSTSALAVEKIVISSSPEGWSSGGDDGGLQAQPSHTASMDPVSDEPMWDDWDQQLDSFIN